MKNLTLLSIALTIVSSIYSQTNDYLVKSQSHQISSTTRIANEKSNDYVIETFNEEIWKVTPIEKDKYKLEQTEFSVYSRRKDKGEQWRTINSMYSQFNDSRTSLHNEEIILEVLKDELKVLGEDSEKIHQSFNNSFWKYYFLGNKNAPKSELAIKKKEKDGKVTYSFKDKENIVYNPASFIIIDKANVIGSDFTSNTNVSTKRDTKEFDWNKRDSLEINYQTRIETTRKIKTIEISNDPYKVVYRDENHVHYDSIYPVTNATLRGKITNFHKGTHISIDYTESLPGSFKRKAFVFHPDENGEFEFKMYLDKPVEFDFWHHEQTHFILAPGDDLYLSLDMVEFDETVKWTGVGSEKNQFLADRFLFEETNKIRQRDWYDNISETMTSNSADEYKSLCDSVSKIKFDFLEKYKSQLMPSDYLSFYYFEYLNNYSLKSGFPRSQSYYRKEAGKEPLEIDADLYYNFRDDFHADNDLMSYSSGYKHNIREIVFFDLLDKFRKDNRMGYAGGLDGIYKRRVNYTELLHSGLSKYYLNYLTLGDVVRRGSWELTENMMSDFRNEYPDTELLDELETVYAKAQTVAPGQMAYDFELEDLDGNKVRLSDFRGKAVYIDFWSTGCGPCRYAIENYSAKLKDKMKDKDVVFMYIACEGNVDRVRKYMEDNRVEGVLLIAKNQEALIRDKYWFNGIPHYYIIGRDGKIVHRNAASPNSLLHNQQPLLDALNNSANSEITEL
ncbi:TlpA family protein disulfide reductase [Carboxylicivirga linearis]|uniref:TlpA family protein disulfide reductase n=1 Tax=Carboxylicivirga linearis TaxID=1628157 RepID=A0ABS5JV76_9BACT|nr:TlpA disulfide reductase family protein [Carboxylicivirga linearis]MBS2098379.1 TlpA family protein disulfide reductase [Carboxylicivirga linearis]